MVLKALVAANDGDACDRVGATLRLEWPGARLQCVTSGRRAIDGVREACPDLVVLDLGLPDGDGLEALTTIRRFSSVAVVVIAKSREDGLSWRHAVELGADEYVVTPFAPLELLARVGAVVRQRESGLSSADPAQPEAMPDRVAPFPALSSRSRGTGTGRFGDDYLSLDVAARRTYAGGVRVCLTGTEYAFLDRLAGRPDRVVTVDVLLTELWGREGRGRTEFPRIYARRLRERIEPDPDTPRYVLTERGVGYRLALSDWSPIDPLPMAPNHGGDGTWAQTTN